MHVATVLIERHDGWCKLTLNRPEKLNAFDDAMHGALAAALDQAADDPGCRAILLTGTGRGFCAGQDLAARRGGTAGPPDLGDTLERLYNPLVRRLRALSQPVVCAVNGVAAGAGANIALACDIVLAAASAKFIQAFARIGLIPDSGGTYFLPRLIGAARARALALTAEPVGAEQAAAWGMIWRAVADPDLMAQAEALTARLSQQPAGALAMIKRALDASENNTLTQQLDLERDLQRDAGRSADYAEGVAAFLDKRPAQFNREQP